MGPPIQRLPCFRPPSFENNDGILPLPESPESTVRGEDTEGFRCPQKSVVPSTESKMSPRTQRQADERHTEPEPEQPAAESSGVYPAGTFVEYKSRSSGLWILARVQGYNEGSQTYCLDVQKHAQPSRVRQRKSSAREHVQSYSDIHKNSEKHVPRTTIGGLCEDRGSFADLRSLQRRPPLTHDVKFVEAYAKKMENEDNELSGAGTGELLAEVMALKDHIVRLEGKRKSCQDSVMHEVTLKDRYFAELCLCREQLQRVRSTHH